MDSVLNCPGTPVFFVPAATPDNQESVYADFAKWCSREAPELSRRIYSIRYHHDGVEWNATVGKQLEGIKVTTSRIKGKKVEKRLPVYDPAFVLAIFPGNPFIVVTNHRLVGNIGSKWENPFMAGRPHSISYFSAS